MPVYHRIGRIRKLLRHKTLESSRCILSAVCKHSSMQSPILPSSWTTPNLRAVMPYQLPAFLADRIRHDDHSFHNPSLRQPAQAQSPGSRWSAPRSPSLRKLSCFSASSIMLNARVLIDPPILSPRISPAPARCFIVHPVQRIIGVCPIASSTLLYIIDSSFCKHFPHLPIICQNLLFGNIPAG